MATLRLAETSPLPSYAILPETLRGVGRDIDAAYVHVPFCSTKCHYCDFYSFASGKGELAEQSEAYLAALQTELSKLGAEVEIDGDVLTVHPPEKLKVAAIDTYDDHRMAMSFSLAASKSAGIRINDPACVNKTYPGYFEDLKRFGILWG